MNDKIVYYLYLSEVFVIIHNWSDCVTKFEVSQLLMPHVWALCQYTTVFSYTLDETDIFLIFGLEATGLDLITSAGSSGKTLDLLSSCLYWGASGIIW